MTQDQRPRPGQIVWRDLTVPDAAKVQAFYTKVIGWGSEAFEGDFNLFPPGETAPIAGICYARGPNEHLPGQWLMYVVVEDLTKSVAAAQELGGSIIDGPRPAGNARFCVVRDPAGAVVALYEPASGP